MTMLSPANNEKYVPKINPAILLRLGLLSFFFGFFVKFYKADDIWLLVFTQRQTMLLIMMIMRNGDDDDDVDYDDGTTISFVVDFGRRGAKEGVSDCALIIEEKLFQKLVSPLFVNGITFGQDEIKRRGAQQYVTHACVGRPRSSARLTLLLRAQSKRKDY